MKINVIHVGDSSQNIKPKDMSNAELLEYIAGGSR